MAQLNYPDIGGSYREGLAFGTQQRQIREGEERRSALSNLAAEAYGAAPADRTSILSRMAALSPEAAQQQNEQFESGDDRRNKQLVSMAKLLTAAPDAYKDSVYQRMRPALGQLGLQQVPDAYSPEVGQLASRLAQAWGVAPTNEMRTFEAMSANLSPEDRAKAQRINLGLDPRAVTGAVKFGTIVGADGRTRATRQNPATMVMEVYDDAAGDFVPLGSGGAQAAAPAGAQLPSGPSVQMHSDMLASAADAMSKAGVDPAVIEAFIAAQTRGREDAPVGSSQPAANPALGVSRAPEDQAALTTAAQEQAKIDAEIGAYSRMTGLEADRAAAVEGAKTGAKAAAERADTQRTKADALRVYEAGIAGLRNALSGTVLTGPLAGRLPAVTTGQQIAQGGVAAMAPILKQIFRSAGEGTFTDSDQKLLMDMLPTRTDTPQAAASKMANIDAIVRAKLGAGAGAGAAPPAAGNEPAQAVSTTARRLKFNPATGKIE